MKTEEQRLAHNARMRAWNANNRDKVREAQKRFRDANPRKVKSNLLRKYGITLEQFEAMLKNTVTPARSARPRHQVVRERSMSIIVTRQVWSEVCFATTVMPSLDMPKTK